MKGFLYSDVKPRRRIVDVPVLLMRAALWPFVTIAFYLILRSGQVLGK